MKALIVGACLLVSSVAWAAPTLTVNDSSAAISVALGSVVTVGVQNGPGTSFDCVGLYPTSAGLFNSALSYSYVTGTTAILPFTMPSAPGPYEFRFFQGCGNAQKLATSPTVTVQSVLTGCTVNPSSVTSGNWSDPATWPGGCLPGATD